MYQLISTFPYCIQVAIVTLPAVSIVIAACALLLNARQAKIGNKLVRAKLVSESLHTFMDDEVIQKAFYKIEYGKFCYDGGFHDSAEEAEIDKLLRHFSNLALLWKVGTVTLKDIQPVQYFIVRVANDSNIQEYLKFIDNWSRTSGTGGHPYTALSELVDALK